MPTYWAHDQKGNQWELIDLIGILGHQTSHEVLQEVHQFALQQKMMKERVAQEKTKGFEVCVCVLGVCLSEKSKVIQKTTPQPIPSFPASKVCSNQYCFQASPKL